MFLVNKEKLQAVGNNMSAGFSIGYGTLNLNTQLTFTIFDGLSLIKGIIDVDDGGSIDMTFQDKGPYFVGAVTSSVWRPINLDPFLCCRRC